MNFCRSVVAATLAVGCLLLTTGAGLAQDKTDKAKSKTKSYTFHGKVTSVTSRGLTVNGEKVEGWMDAMTMNYPVDKPDTLKTVKVGDQITATVYEGDMTLHSVQVVPAGKADSKQSTK